jgi:hypothetical protein
VVENNTLLSRFPVAYNSVNSVVFEIALMSICKMLMLQKY